MTEKTYLVRDLLRSHLYRVMVTGSRNWTDKDAVWNALDTQFQFALENGKEMVLVHGDCPTGADKMADDWFKHNSGMFDKLSVERYPANWIKYGKAAGPKRNKAMVESNPNIVLAFPFADSRGTLNAMSYAREAGIETKVF